MRSLLRASRGSAGIVSNWDDMQHVWDYTFRERLRVEPASARRRLRRPAAEPEGEPGANGGDDV